MPLDPIGSLGGLGSLGKIPSIGPKEATGTAPASTFANMVNGLLDGNRQATVAADTAVQQLASGEAQDLHSVALATAQADLSFRLILEMRNRLTDAYQEVMRMQV